MYSNPIRRLALAACVAVASSPALADIRVVDGDTIVRDGVTHRIHGIDAPEAGQSCAMAGGGEWPCGEAASEAMERLVGSGDVACDDRGEDDYGRTLSVCRAGGLDLGAALVAAGLAWSFRRYSDDYNQVEEAARRARVGVWQAATEAPWEFRSRRWESADQEGPPGCPIKGNINRKGERIYHVPWAPSWAETRIDTSRGERWFCDEAEALAAGWRAPAGR